MNETQTYQALVRLEAVGQLPPGYTLKNRTGGDPLVEIWGWVYEGAEGRSQQTVGSKIEAFTSAWSRFWRTRLGEVPPGYAVGRVENGRWAWTFAEEDRVSNPKDSREETTAETWKDWKAKLIGSERPACQVNENDPMAIMGKFQQASFQLVHVEEQLEALTHKRDHLKKEMRHHALLFNHVMTERQKRGGESKG